MEHMEPASGDVILKMEITLLVACFALKATIHSIVYMVYVYIGIHQFTLRMVGLNFFSNGGERVSIIYTSSSSFVSSWN